MKNIYEINAFLEESGKIMEFHLSISAPLLNVDGEDFYCKVLCPALFENEKEIYGVDEAQAKELVVEFVIRVLRERQLLDKNGKLIDFENSLRALLDS
jgi:hypothetical protein